MYAEVLNEAENLFRASTQASPTLRAAMALLNAEEHKVKRLPFSSLLPPFESSSEKTLGFLTRDEVNGSSDKFWLTEFLI